MLIGVFGKFDQVWVFRAFIGRSTWSSFICFRPSPTVGQASFLTVSLFHTQNSPLFHDRKFRDKFQDGKTQVGTRLDACSPFDACIM